GHAVANAAGKSGVAPDDKVILLVENRPKRQDMLRDYFTRHGYRVLLLGDADRALARLKTMSPYGVILFDEATGERAVDDFRQALQMTEKKSVAVVLVLNKTSESAVDPQAAQNPRGTILATPVNLRKLRNVIESVHGETGAS
ncbi:MAG TPA: serine/threonine protein kinase, partial [Planctomicrobium sp.]|nr:serine/threonine protein kinase [Planctomicrobium sp.]